MKLPTLYHQTKTGKIVEWNCYTVAAEVHVEWGEKGGKKQHTFTTCTAKNVGKSNEVNPVEQAKIEAKAKWTHQVERKYSETIKEAKETVFLPMLAHKYVDKKHKVKFPVDVQPKLNGFRCLAYWEKDKLVLMSRGGETWNLPHIEKAVAKILPKNMVLDGEIYKHKTSLQKISKLINTFEPGPEGTESLRFYVYDYFMPTYLDEPWNQRRDSLEYLMLAHENQSTVWPLYHQEVNSEEELFKACNKFLKEGYEGAIVRLLDGKYELGHRSSSLLKVKPVQDAEFKIVGHYLGKGKHEGCVGYVCQTKEGKEFRCYPKGTLEERRALKDNIEQSYGQLLKVEFEMYSDEGIPLKPIGIIIRSKKDL